MPAQARKTDDNGRFVFNDVEVGLYDMAFLSLTHHDQVVKEVLGQVW